MRVDARPYDRRSDGREGLDAGTDAQRHDVRDLPDLPSAARIETRGSAEQNGLRETGRRAGVRDGAPSDLPKRASAVARHSGPRSTPPDNLALPWTFVQDDVDVKRGVARVLDANHRLICETTPENADVIVCAVGFLYA